MNILDGINVSLILGSVSTHTTTEFEPANQYNQNHKSIGVEVAQSKEGITNGLQLFKFKDSFNKNSHTVLYSLGYRKTFETSVYSDVRFGISGGYVDTSYYNGAVAMPFVGGFIGRVGLDISYLPKVKRADSVLMVQFKVKLGEL